MILYAEEYYIAWNYIPVLVGASLFSSFVTFFARVYVVKKKSVNSVLTSMVGAIINIILNLLLIPDGISLFGKTVTLAGLGAQGAAIATLVSYLAVFVIRAIDSRRLLRFEIGSLNLSLNALILGVQAVIMLFATDLAFLIVGQAVCVVAIGIVNAKPFIEAARMIVGRFARKTK